MNIFYTEFYSSQKNSLNPNISVRIVEKTESYAIETHKIIKCITHMRIEYTSNLLIISTDPIVAITFRVVICSFQLSLIVYDVRGARLVNSDCSLIR